MPLVIASAIGGPLAGYAVGFFGLRLLATPSLLAAAAGLAGLGCSDFHNPGLGVVAPMALLGLSLSFGLTASSLAIMSSAPVDKAGAAGALEGTGYEMGAGLDITFFGVLLATSYSKALRLPENRVGTIPERAGHSIGETMLAARELGEAGGPLVEAARLAFTNAHSTVLLSAAVLVGLMALAVLVALRHYRDAEAGGRACIRGAAALASIALSPYRAHFSGSPGQKACRGGS